MMKMGLDYLTITGHIEIKIDRTKPEISYLTILRKWMTGAGKYIENANLYQSYKV